MRTWLMTNTYYGTWLPGDARGSVTSVRDLRPGEVSLVRLEHDLPGTPWEEEIPGLYRAALEQMNGPPVFLDLEKAQVVSVQFQETARYRKHRLLALAIMYNHLHFVVEVPDDPDPRRVLADYKAYGSRALNSDLAKPLQANGGRKRLQAQAQGCPCG